jgi:hypothetical protein
MYTTVGEPVDAAAAAEDDGFDFFRWRWAIEHSTQIV